MGSEMCIRDRVKALLQLGLHLVVVLLLHLSPLEVLVAVRAQVQQSSKILQQRLAQHPQPQPLTVVPVARPLQAVVPLPPAAVPVAAAVAAVDPAVVPLDRLDRLDLVVHLDPQVVEDITAADTN